MPGTRSASPTVGVREGPQAPPDEGAWGVRRPTPFPQRHLPRDPAAPSRPPTPPAPPQSGQHPGAGHGAWPPPPLTAVHPPPPTCSLRRSAGHCPGASARGSHTPRLVGQPPRAHWSRAWPFPASCVQGQVTHPPAWFPGPCSRPSWASSDPGRKWAGGAGCHGKTRSGETGCLWRNTAPRAGSPRLGQFWG